MTTAFQQAADPASSRELISALLAQDTPVCFKAGGPSMTPTIRDGETVQIRPAHPEDLRDGTILLYSGHNRLILHRLIRSDRRTGELQLTGDAALRGEDRIPAGAIIGVATAVQRAGRTRRLDTRAARFRGQLRYWIRPVRRLMWSLKHPPHAGTPCI